MLRDARPRIDRDRRRRGQAPLRLRGDRERPRLLARHAVERGLERHVGAEGVAAVGRAVEEETAVRIGPRDEQRARAVDGEAGEGGLGLARVGHDHRLRPRRTVVVAVADGDHDVDDEGQKRAVSPGLGWVDVPPPAAAPDAGRGRGTRCHARRAGGRRAHRLAGPGDRRANLREGVTRDRRERVSHLFRACKTRLGILGQGSADDLLKRRRHVVR